MIQAYFARHAQTLVGSLGRMVSQPFATLMTMGVIALALALPLLLNLLLTNVHTATGNWSDAFDLSVYLDKKVSANRVAALAKQLRQRRRCGPRCASSPPSRRLRSFAAIPDSARRSMR